MTKSYRTSSGGDPPGSCLSAAFLILTVLAVAGLGFAAGVAAVVG